MARNGQTSPSQNLTSLSALDADSTMRSMGANSIRALASTHKSKRPDILAQPIFLPPDFAVKGKG